jgi:hypothetical protein
MRNCFNFKAQFDYNYVTYISVVHNSTNSGLADAWMSTTWSLILIVTSKWVQVLMTGRMALCKTAILMGK